MGYMDCCLAGHVINVELYIIKHSMGVSSKYHVGWTCNWYSLIFNHMINILGIKFIGLLLALIPPLILIFVLSPKKKSIFTFFPLVYHTC